MMTYIREAAEETISMIQVISKAIGSKYHFKIFKLKEID